MSNVTTGNPWVLDTAAEITTHPTKIKRMIWSPTTAGDDLLVVDNAGNTIFKLKALAADTNQGIEYERVLEHSVNGVTITTIDHGTLYVHL